MFAYWGAFILVHIYIFKIVFSTWIYHYVESFLVAYNALYFKVFFNLIWILPLLLPFHSQLQGLFFPQSITLEKAMATHSGILAWKIPWTEEPGRLESMGSWRVGNDWAASLSLFTFMHWKKKWQRTPVFLPGESQGWQSLGGCCLRGHTELDTTEMT